MTGAERTAPRAAAQQSPAASPRSELWAALAVPLDTLPLPSRLAAVAERKGLVTVADLVRITPRDLLGEHSLGRKSIHDGRKILERMLGCSWEQAALLLSRSAPEAVDPLMIGTDGGIAPAMEPDPNDWDVVRKSLPDVIRASPLEDIDLPRRVRAYAHHQKLETVADLATRSVLDLLAAGKLGRAAAPQIVHALGVYAERIEAGRLYAEAGLLESWQGLLQNQEAVRRLVLTRRAGFNGQREKLHSIGDMLGVSRERVRQLESRVIQDLSRERGWLDEVRRRFDAVLRDGAVLLDTLAADPWWAAIAALPEALDYFGERMLDGAARVVEVNEQCYLARSTQAALDEGWSSLRDKAAELPLPSPLSAFTALTDALMPTLGRTLTVVLSERLRELLHIEDGEGPEPRVVSFGSTNAAAAIAILRASPAPMRIEELYARAGRFRAAEELLFFDRGLVGLEQHFPDFRAWVERVTPPIWEVMQREAPERQWLSTELLEEAREAAPLPDWLGHWHLASLLRRSERFRYLGRNRFALYNAPDERGRIRYSDELSRILREHGGPMRRDDLMSELRKKTSAPEMTIATYLARPPFLRVDSERIGLLERDLPGGAPALAHALEHVAGVLEDRQRGLGSGQLQAQVSRLSPEHAQWTEEMCLSVLRGDPRFKQNGVGAVGLSAWGNVRVPARRQAAYE